MYYKLTAIKVNDDGTEEVVMDSEEFDGFSMLGGCHGEDKFSEVMMHETLMGLASKIAQSEHFKPASKLAEAVEGIAKSQISSLERMLIDKIGGEQ